MKIRITTLFSMLVIGIATSMAQLAWVYDGQTLSDGETLTVNDNAENLLIGFYIDIANQSSNSVNCIITRETIDNEVGYTFMMCCGINCYTGEETGSFSIGANSVYEDFHTQVLVLGNGEATVAYTVSDGTNSAVVNVTYVIDDDDSNNGVTIGSASSVNNISTTKNNTIITLSNSVLTIEGATAGQQVRIIDLTGRLAASYVVTGDGTQSYDLNLGHGIYIVALQENGRTTYAQKVISR